MDEAAANRWARKAVVDQWLAWAKEQELDPDRPCKRDLDVFADLVVKRAETEGRPLALWVITANRTRVLNSLAYHGYSLAPAD
jgi:hypothetical protein